MDWDLYRLFLDVARHGGLSGASLATGLSAATLGRQMLDLERRLGRDLFLRSQTGYRLTSDGQALLDQLQEMEAAARRVEDWREAASGGPLVRVAVGTWNAWLFAANFAALQQPGDRFQIGFFVGEARASLSYRESDIGIRAFEPEEPNLAARLLCDVAYAIYGRRNDPRHEGRYLAASEEAAISPYLRWPHRHKSSLIVASVNRPRSLLDLVRAGAGRAVLPCFVGDLHPDLARFGGEIVELRHKQWIVMNKEDRHRPEIRGLADRITRLVKSQVDLFAGRRPNSL